MQGGDSVTLPIVSGTLNRSTGYGSLMLGGAYSYAENAPPNALKAGPTADFENLQVVLGARSSTLVADVDGQRQTVFKLGSFKVIHGTQHLKMTVPARVSSNVVSLLDSFAEPSTFVTNGLFGWISVEIPL